LWAHRGARLVPGAGYVLDAVGFDDRARESGFVVTGEGCLDAQSLDGKVCGEVATRCRRRGVPCHAIVGQNALERSEEQTAELASVTEATTLEELEAAGRRLVSSE
ncbi:MAG: glycerate kinase, partial [Actinomycetota bacterium]|nr:glycerate kinase [Actinomycetota bacterium]